MDFLNSLNFGFSRKLNLILQSEATECGLACLAMVVAYHNFPVNLTGLRRDFPISLKGATLSNLIDISTKLGFGTRPVKVDIQNLSHLKLPCILHWEFNHFVVLSKITRSGALIFDPAVGVRKLELSKLSSSFTGVALEMWPSGGFERRDLKPKFSLFSVVGKITGLRRSIVQILILAIALEIFAIVSPFFLQWVVDNALISGDRSLLTTLALGFTFVLILQNVVSMIRGWAIMHMGTSINVQWRANTLSHLLSLPVQYFEKRHLGDVVSRFGAIDQIQRTLTTSFVEGLLDGVMAIATLGLMFSYSPALAFISVVAMVLYLLVRMGWYFPLKSSTSEQFVHGARQQTHLLETIRGIKSIKLFNRQNNRRAAWLGYFVEQVNSELKVQKMQIFYKGANGLVFGGSNIIIIWLGGHAVLDGNLTVGMMMAFISYKLLFENRIIAFIDKILEFSLLGVQTERLADIVLESKENTRDHEDVDISEKAVSISVANMSFRYSNVEPLIIDDVTFTINAGESVAIIGPSGAGKSTLINLLIGVLSPTSGDLLVSNLSLKQHGPGLLRKNIGTVLQDDTLFAGSIADNISFFDPHPDSNRIAECAYTAAILTEILAMPMGMNTLVGDMGTVLSGGQKQRILLARALYKRPKILLLDEATSNLDVAKEREVNKAIASLNITKIIVAHRPETIASADRVLCLHKKKLVPYEEIFNKKYQSNSLSENSSERDMKAA